MFKSFVALSLASSALAHGVVSYINDDGQGFNGPDPNQSADSPIWTAGINPVTDAYSPDMFCGPDSSTNNKMSSIGAGSTMTIYWEETSYQQWPHNTGPILTYLAACNGDCANMDAGSAKWFKIDQQAMSGGQWTQATLMNGSGYQVTIPSDLADGNYLMRTEIIALHNSYPEFYPRCVSWTITGGGSNSYSADATASFPGTYSPSDPGLADSGSSIYNVQSTSDYQFPGPDVVTVGQGGGSGSSSAAPAQPSANVNVQVSTQEDDGDDDESAQENTSAAPFSTSQAAAQPTQQAAAQEDTESETDEAAAPMTSSSSSSSASAAPSSTASSDASCSSQAGEDDCETKWTQCNNNYTPGTDYTCQDEFASCRGQSVQRRLASNAKMMRKRVKRDMHKHAHRHH